MCSVGHPSETGTTGMQRKGLTDGHDHDKGGTMAIVAKLIAIIIPKKLQVVDVQVAKQDLNRKDLDDRLNRIIELSQMELEDPL